MARTLAREEKGKKGAQGAARRSRNAMAGGIVAVAAAAVLVVGYLAMSAGPRRTPAGLVANGEQAPTFSLGRLGAAGSVSLADLKGKVVAVNFWHSQ